MIAVQYGLILYPSTVVQAALVFPVAIVLQQKEQISQVLVHLQKMFIFHAVMYSIVAK